MGKGFKKFRKAIGLGGKTLDININEFVLTAIWPDGTWYLDDVEELDADQSVRRWLYDVYIYEQKLDFERRFTQAYHAPAQVTNLPLDWYPSANIIRAYNNDPGYDGWEDQYINYILARLQSLNHLRR